MSRELRRLALCAVIVAAAACWAAAQEQPTMTPEIVESLRSVTQAVISPDGAMVAYVLGVPREPTEEPGLAHAEIWVVSFEGGAARPYVTGAGRATSVAWSPDGGELAFLSDRGGGTQVHAIPIGGGEARPLTSSPTSVHSFRWSPDGGSIAYVATDPLGEDEQAARAAGRDWRVVDRDYRHRRIHVVDLEGGADRVVTPAQYSVWAFNWSPCGRYFVAAASDIPTTDASYMFKHLYVVDIADGSRRLLCATEGKLGTPAWSPGGGAIAWNGAVDLYDETTGSLFIVPAGGGEPLNLTPGYEGTVMSFSWLDDETIAYTALERQHTFLYLQPAAGGGPRRVTEAGPIFTSADFSGDGSRFAACASTATHPNELFVGEAEDRTLERLSDSNPVLHGMRFGEQEIVSWTAGDGLELEGVLIKPVGFRRGERYPLVVQVHGGPESAYMDGWNTSYSRWSQMLAGRGYVVFQPNYRASTGRGVAFGKADHFDLGGREFRDVVDGVDHLIEIGMVDPDRVGIGGGSYGGYFSAIAATRFSHRFAAAVVFAGITNWFSFQGTSDIPWENTLVHWEQKWYEHPAETWAGSPMAYIRDARTPTLIAHGERDLRVPLGQGWELYTGMRFVGCPVEFVIYPREPHGLREPAHRLDYAARAIAWFDRYLINGGTAGTD